MSVLEKHFFTQVVLPSRTGVPRDNFSNTFHWRGYDNADLGDIATRATEKLSAFYTTIEGILNGYVLLGETLYLKTYDGSVAPGLRYPVETTIAGLTFSEASASLPAECCICLSYYGGAHSTKRTRGRIYLGPLNHASTTGTTNDLRVSSASMTTINAAAVALATAETGLGTEISWTCYSPVSNTHSDIHHGWTDNAIDIQRKRGQVATARVTWST